MEKKTPKSKKVHEPLTQECKNKRQALSQIRKLLTVQKISFRTKNYNCLWPCRFGENICNGV